jgi:hypothetical protein
MAACKHKWEAHMVLIKVTLLVAFIVCLDCFAQFKMLPLKWRGKTFEEIQLIIKSKRKKKTLTDQVKRKQSGIKKKSIVATTNSFRPLIMKSSQSVHTLERFYGITDGNLKILGSELQEVKVKIVQNGKFPRNSYLSCTANNRAIYMHYRIDLSCSRLITPSFEIEIKAIIRDLKKIKGITPDHVAVGEDIKALKSLGLGAIGAMINVSKDRVLTMNGYASTPSQKNALKDFALGGVKNIVNSDQGEASIVLSLKDRKKVIIEFLEPVRIGAENENI